MQQTIELQGHDDAPVVKPKDGKVKLTCKGVRTGSGIKWSLDENEHGPASGKVARIEVPKGSGPCAVTIKIKMDNPDVTFDLGNPLSAREGSCPPAGSGIATDQIDPKSIEVDEKDLTFVDLNNGGPRVIHYALNFVGAEPFDPVIKNDG